MTLSKKQKYIIKGIVEFFVSFFIIYALIWGCVGRDAQAQVVSPEWAVRISWSSNPAPEQVEKYIVSWFDGDSQDWIKLADVDHADDTTLEYVTRLSWIKSTLQVGNDLCFNIAAVKGETIVVGDSECITIIQLGEEVSLVGVTAPVKPDLEFFIIDDQ